MDATKCPGLVPELLGRERNHCAACAGQADNSHDTIAHPRSHLCHEELSNVSILFFLYKGNRPIRRQRSTGLLYRLYHPPSKAIA